jgi:DNA invertase Pin-like site-specific DNA recombinase
MIDVLNTVNEFTSRGVRLHSIMDNLDPSSAQGRMQLAIMATLAEYERELINERVRAGVISAQKRGVRFGPAPMEESIARDRVNTARQLMADGKTAAHAAKTVGWSKATLTTSISSSSSSPSRRNCDEAMDWKPSAGRVATGRRVILLSSRSETR